MRILVVSLPDLKKIPPQRPHYLLTELSKEHDITVLSVNAWWLDEKKDSKAMLKDIYYFYITNKKLHPVIQEIYGILKYKKFNINEFDVLINFNSLLLGYFMSKKMISAEKKVVFDICDDIPETIYNSQRIPSVLKPLARVISRFAMKRNVEIATALTYVTRSLKKTYNFPEYKSKKVPNGVNVSAFTYQLNDFKEQLGLKEKFVIGHLGVLSEWVNLELAFHVIKEICKEYFNIKMIIIGTGEKYEYFKKLVRQLEISENVIFAGFVPEKELLKYLLSTDVCLICRTTTQDSQNSFPLKLLQYMACGKPIISMPLAGVKEVAGNNIMYASTPGELKEKIIQLYNNPKLRKRMSKRNLTIAKRYDWNIIFKEFKKIITEAK